MKIHATVLRKDIARFAPLWGLYTVFMLMFLLLLWDAEGTAARFANSISDTLGAMGAINLMYAGLAATVLFGDLFNTRSCNMLHAMPLRREGWFVTHLAAGLLFCLVPNLIGCAVAAAFLAEYAFLSLLWLGIMALQYLFFFGLGVFSALCAGNALGAVAVYAIANFLAVLAGWLVDTFYEPFLYGIIVNQQSFSHFSPVVFFSNNPYVQTHYDNMTGTMVLESISSPAWIYSGVAAAVGAALLVLAVLLYRKRNMESAGDMISLKPVAPVFLVTYTLCVAAVAFFISESLSTPVRFVFLLIGLLVGFFTGRMLLEKKVGVFRWKNILSFAVFATVFGATIGLTALDPIGITRWIPGTEKIASITISPYQSPYSISYQSCILTDAADIEAIRTLHREAVDDRPDFTGPTISLNIRYTLKNGRIVTRNYSLPETEDRKDLLNHFYSRPSCVLRTDDIEQLQDQLYVLEVWSYDEACPEIFICNENYTIHGLYGEQPYEKKGPLDFSFTGSFAQQPIARGLIEAIYADCLDGNISQWQRDHYTIGRISLHLLEGDHRYSFEIEVFANSEHTRRYLQALLPLVEEAP